MNESVVYIPTRNAAYRKISDEVVIVDTANNKMLTLNKTASEIWCMLDGKSVRDIVDALVETFQVEKVSASVDVENFLSDMEKRGLIAPARDTASKATR